MDLSKISDEAILDGCRLFLCAINPVIIVKVFNNTRNAKIDNLDGESINDRNIYKISRIL